MAIRLLYRSVPEWHIPERAVREALEHRDGDWTVCLVEPPHQALWVIVIDGPDGFTKTWAFDQDDQRLIVVRDAIDRDLREAGF